MSINSLGGAAGWALVAALALGTGSVARAQEGDDGGPVIEIGKGDATDDFRAPQFPPRPATTDGAIVTEPGTLEEPEALRYWIGLVGESIGPNHPLRAHIDIPEQQGVLVTRVVSDGPAARAGLKKNDILLRANDAELREMRDLAELVRTAGAKSSQISLEVLRHGQRETVYVAPEARPARRSRAVDNGSGGEIGPHAEMLEELGLPEELLEGLLEFRNLGPGVIIDRPGRAGIDQMPSGVTVSIVKEKGQTARITVRRGDETWEVVADDPASLDQLPDDLRPFVEQLLHCRSPEVLKRRRPGRLLPELGEGRLRERLDRIEQRMEELQERFSAPEATPPAEPPRERDDAN